MDHLNPSLEYAPFSSNKAPLADFKQTKPAVKAHSRAEDPAALHVSEVLLARDAAIRRLEEAYTNIRKKATLIEQMGEQAGEKDREIETLKIVVTELKVEVERLEQKLEVVKAAYEQMNNNDIDHAGKTTLLLSAQNELNDQKNTATQTTISILHSEPTELPSLAALAQSRHTLLASLPLPEQVPADALKPIVIPPPWTLHEFLSGLGSTNGPLRNALTNYRVFQHLTTAWCPSREEHGYMLTPLFKCSTNPRVPTAHRWSEVDFVARMGKPTECFYNKDGKWYYAGVYKAFRMADLTIKEWEALSPETSQALIKETLTARKNTSPQNIYETSQLYLAGALKVACVGLQCVGFNTEVYRAVVEGAGRCARTGKWGGNSSKTEAAPSPLISGVGWNSTLGSQDVSDGVTGMSIAPGVENAGDHR